MYLGTKQRPCEPNPSDGSCPGGNGTSPSGPSSGSSLSSETSTITFTSSVVVSPIPNPNSNSDPSPASSSLKSPSHGLSPGAIAGLTIGIVAFLSLTILALLFICRRRLRDERKRTMEVGKASHVDLADPQLPSGDQHSNGNGNSGGFYKANWLIPSKMISHPPSSYKGGGVRSGETGGTSDFTFLNTVPPSSMENHNGATTTNTTASDPLQRRRSIATFTSTSDSRSQGSMVIGSRAFWAAIGRPPSRFIKNQPPVPTLALHEPPPDDILPGYSGPSGGFVDEKMLMP